MVKYRIDPLSEVFRALADPTRRAILTTLTRGPVTVGELAEPFDMSLPAVSKHLRVLENAGLLRQRRDGRMRLCHLDPAPMHEAAGWIDDCRRFWDGQLDQLERYLAEDDTDSQQTKERNHGPATEKT